MREEESRAKWAMKGEILKGGKWGIKERMGDEVKVDWVDGRGGVS